ncbi:hypothetical protein CYMTET_24115 [Cymbomonas tetramitiformis]|uniref:Small ubiquitin-related modifier n=1 Tax=Cymbomonas tetramitiformis TaxID=36881 RepID=A0AAE0L0E1_9CHLO|nr:hypothetical protein CYMTET_24115 [Cymbomonas tetramitiformis]
MPDEKKPDTSAINLKVKDQEGTEVFFKVKMSTPFEKIFKAYCDKKSLKLESLRFLHDGAHLRPDQTPGGRELEDGDEIQVMVFQEGGGQQCAK